jgi:hypothetical protein
MSPISIPGKVTLAKELTWNETLWNPSMIQTALWLDAADASTMFDATSGGSLVAADGAVARWQDKSGNGNHATQSSSGSRPIRKTGIQNGRDTLLFDGSDDWLSGAATPCTSNAKTIISVTRNSNAVGGTVYMNRQENDNKFLARQLFAASTSFVGGDSVVNNVTITGNFSTTWQSFTISSWTQQTTDRAVFYWNNGTSYATTGIPNNEDGGAGYRVGVAQGSSGILIQYHPGDIAELVILNSQASTDTRQRIEGYLAHKWGLTANLPNDHPYKLVGPTP